MQDELLGLLAARNGHYRFESGHHGTLWLDLDSLFLRAGQLHRFTRQLAQRLAHHDITAVCGPLVGGALISYDIAEDLGVRFFYTERMLQPGVEGLYPVRYRAPAGLRAHIAGERVAVVDDVISAGSALRATIAELEACGAKAVAVGALLVFGDAGPQYCDARALALESIAQRASELWTPEKCPLCAAGVPLDQVDG